jgi:hypothetical protein
VRTTRRPPRVAIGAAAVSGRRSRADRVHPRFFGGLGGKDFFEQGLTAAKALGRRALLLVGDDGPPGSLPESVASFDYAPYGRLLPHARLVVHHGRIGTTAQALRAGRPMLVVRSPMTSSITPHGLRV